jgi:hypothetical protein
MGCINVERVAAVFSIYTTLNGFILAGDARGSSFDPALGVESPPLAGYVEI